MLVTFSLVYAGFGLEDLKANETEIRDVLSEVEDKASCPLLKLLNAS